jgi:hypothetical protein
LQNAINATKANLLSYIKQYNISTYTGYQISPIIKKQQKIIALINMIYPKYSIAKDSLIDTLTYGYQAQIDSIIAIGKTTHYGSQIDIALQYANELQLMPTQILQLQEKSLQLNNIRKQFNLQHPDAEFDSKSFESSTLNEVVNADQYTQILTIKYSNQAATIAQQDWEQVVKYNITNLFDTTTTKSEVTNYHLAILIAYYRNAHDKELQYRNIKTIQEMMPEVLKILVDKWEYKTPYSDTPGTFFQW